MSLRCLEMWACFKTNVFFKNTVLKQQNKTHFKKIVHEKIPVLTVMHMVQAPEDAKTSPIVRAKNDFFACFSLNYSKYLFYMII